MLQVLGNGSFGKWGFGQPLVLLLVRAMFVFSSALMHKCTQTNVFSVCSKSCEGRCVHYDACMKNAPTNEIHVQRIYLCNEIVHAQSRTFILA